MFFEITAVRNRYLPGHSLKLIDRKTSSFQPVRKHTVHLHVRSLYVQSF